MIKFYVDYNKRQSLSHFVISLPCAKELISLKFNLYFSLSD